MSAHDFTFSGLDGGDLNLAIFKGRAVLLTNTATECGYAPQFRGLQELYDTYGDRGFMVLAVPSNDFGDQEPRQGAAIREHCETQHAVTFPMTGKEHVIGQQAHPFFRWIEDEVGEAAMPRWNFHKYLLDPDGELVGAWPSSVEPTSEEVTSAIADVLPR